MPTSVQVPVGNEIATQSDWCQTDRGLILAYSVYGILTIDKKEFHTEKKLINILNLKKCF